MMLRHARRSLVHVATLAGLAWSCSSGGDEGPVTPPPTPSIALTLAASATSISQASAGTVVASLVRNGGFAGNVELTLEGTPAGVTGAFAPASLPNGTSSSTLMLNVGAAAVPATSNMTVRARGAGVTDQTAILALTVSPAPVPAFALTLAPAAVSAAQGASAATTVTVAGSGGFAGQVALTVTGAPAGVTATFNPTSVAGNLLSDEAGHGTGVASISATTESDALAAVAAVLAPSSLTLTIAGTVAPGAYPLIVRGNSAGQTERTAPLTLTVTAAAVPAFTLALSSAALTVQQGASGPVTVNLTREAGFIAAVALTAESLPAGVTAAFVPPSVTASTSVLTLTVGGAVAGGIYPITVRGTTAGLTDRIATLTLTVTAAPPSGYTLAIAPSPVTIVQGANGTATATLTRIGGNAANVTLVATGQPNGMTVTFSPASTTGTTSTATIAVGTAVAPGNYTLTVAGTAAGLPDQSAPLVVSVTAAPVGGSIVWTFCEAANRNPVWFARQDNAGAWTQVAGVNNAFSFNIAGGKGGVAYVLPGSDATDYTLTVLYGTTAELTAQGASTCLSSSTLKTVNGSVSGLAGFLDQAWITLGGSVATATAATPTFSLTTVPDGARDLIATYGQKTLANPIAPAELKKMIIRRGINPAAGSTLPALDFAGAEAFVPLTRNLTIGGAPGATMSFVELYMTSANNASGLIYTDVPGSTAANRVYYGVPAANQSAGDLHAILASALNTTNGTSGDTRSVIKFFKDAVDQTVNVGPAFSTVAVSTLSTAPYVRFRSNWNVQAEYNRYFLASYGQSNGAQDRTASVSATTGYLGAVSTVTLDIPDFTGVAGWLNAYGPIAGVQTMWFSSGAGWSTTGVVGANPAEGVSSTIGQRFGQITP